MSERISQIAKRLADNKDKIVEEWERFVYEEIPESRDKDKEAIRNTIPVLLDKIGSTLSSGTPKHTAELEPELANARIHGEQRARFKNYTLKQVIHEYQLLRKVVLSTLESDGPLEAEDRDVILDSISLGERFAADEFHELQMKAEEDLRTRTQQRDEAEQERDVSRGEVSELISQRGMREIFVSTLAHDFRTPITAARMNIELSFRRRDEAGALELHAGKALENLSRLEGMIQDLLDSSRIRAGQLLPLTMTEFDMNQEVQRTLDFLTAVHGERFDFEPAGRVVGYWDRKGVRRIVENLCSNAIKYGDRMSPIRVSVRTDPGRRELLLSVHNWGPVISQREQHLIFEQFHRSSPQETKGNQGWGIGLALVRGMAESHGGSVRVESSRERGTAFTVVLPMDARSRAPSAA